MTREAFKDLAKDWLIEQGLQFSRSARLGHDEPDMEFVSDVLDLLDALCRPVHVWDERELQESLDWYGHRMDCKRYPYLGGPCCNNIKIKNVNYVPIPGGGVPGVTFLTVNNFGDLVWSYVNSYNVLADRLITRDGIHRVQLINGQWMQSHNSGVTWEPLFGDFVWKDDNIISLDFGWSSQKIWQELEKKVDKREGWDLSQNNYTDDEVEKVLHLIINGAGDKVLTNDGTYKSIWEIIQGLGITFLDTYALLQQVENPYGFYFVYNATADPEFPSNATVNWGFYLWDPIVKIYRLLIPGGFTTGGTGGGEGWLLEQDLTMIGHSIGSAYEGYTFLAGTPGETVLRMWAVKPSVVSYAAPTLVISSVPPAGWIEVGSNLAPALNIVFNRNDAGNLSAARYYKDGVQIASALTTFSHNVAAFIMPDVPVVFRGEADYLDGPIKSNNLGEPVEAGRILAGTVQSNLLEFVDKWYTYWGFGNATTSAQVRSLSGKKLGVAAGEQLVVTIPAGSPAMEFFLPDDLKLAKVEYIEALNTDVLPSFVQTALVVESASPTISRGYRKYRMAPDAGWIQEVNYRFIVTNA